jgi:hypothetical protein
MKATNNLQQSLFPAEFYLHKIAESCQDKERIKNVVKIDELIKITPLLTQFRTRIK